MWRWLVWREQTCFGAGVVRDDVVEASVVGEVVEVAVMAGDGAEVHRPLVPRPLGPHPLGPGPIGLKLLCP